MSYVCADAEMVSKRSELVSKRIYEEICRNERKRQRLFRLYLVYAARALTNKWWYFGIATPELIDDKMRDCGFYHKPKKLKDALNKYDNNGLSSLLKSLTEIIKLCKMDVIFRGDGIIRLSHEHVDALCKSEKFIAESPVQK